MSAAATPLTARQRWHRLLYFFPLQLVVVHFKKNHLLLFYWLVLFGVLTDNLAVKYGVPTLFLHPEYLGEVNVLSHLILGISCGGFIMAFNISSYIINGFRFPFLATLGRPFVKYCYNNLLIPLIFLGYYVFRMYMFQRYKELVPPADILWHISGFLTGNALFILLCGSYFVSTNKNLRKLFGKEAEVPTNAMAGGEMANPVRGVFHRKKKWYSVLDTSFEWRTETYLLLPWRVTLARGSEHYDRRMLQQVFAQNHINASFFEIAAILTILLLGFFHEVAVFQIPASASILLFFTLLIMFSSALHSWLKGWSTIVFIGLFLLINYASQNPMISYTNQAYGVDYETEPADYEAALTIAPAEKEARETADKAHMRQILGRWKLRNQQATGVERPKLVLWSTSGGGLRSAMWTFRALQYTDSVMAGELLPHTALITGSSGGMLGAAYIRELYNRQQADPALPLHASQYTEAIGKDLLNPITFTLFMNDIFIRFQEFEAEPHRYVKDRALAFESQLHKNTRGVLQKRLADYAEPEAQAAIPTMIFAPSVVNDGRRVLISAQPISYLTTSFPKGRLSAEPMVESLEFRQLLEAQQAENVRFSSVIRMSATFPYILPNVSLPTQPQVEVMDAGVRDNYGMVNVIKFLYTFREWISENTSGVVILQLRDKRQADLMHHNPSPSFAESLTSPLGSFYKNWLTVQQYNQEELLFYTGTWFDGDIDIVNLQLEGPERNAPSLSWHLTSVEKQQIRQAVYREDNQAAIQRLHQLVQPQLARQQLAQDAALAH